MTSKSPRNLIEALSEHSGLRAPAGGQPTGTDKARLRRDLDGLDRYLRFHYRLMVILLVIIFVIGIGVALLFINNPKQAAAVVGAVGLGAGGSVKRLGDIGREIANLRLTVALAEGLSGDQLTLVIQALIAKLPH
jgi:hypothetical protein